MIKKLAIFPLIAVLVLSFTRPMVEGASNEPSIAQLQKKITELTKQVKALTSKLSQKEKENANLKKKAAEKDKSIKKLNEDLKKAKNSIAAMEQSMKDKDKSLADQTKKLKEKEGKITEYAKLVEEKDSLIENQKSQLEALMNISEIHYTDPQGKAVSKDSKGAIKWYGFKTEMTTLYLTPSAFAEVSYIINISDTVLSDIGQYFGTSKLPGEIPAYIWKDEPVTKTGYGEYFAKEKRLFINLSKYAPYNSGNEENFISVFTHEYAHAFQDTYLNFNEVRGDKYNSDMLWLNEGMANFINNQQMEYKKYNLPDSQLTMKYKRGKDHYKGDILGTLSHFNKPLNGLTSLLDDSYFKNYPLGESMVYYIEVSYGRHKLFPFIESLRSMNISDSMVKHFGVTEAQFIQDWKEYYSLQ